MPELATAESPAAASGLSPAPETIADLLQPSAVPMATLAERYGPLLELVRALIGVVPRCDEYLEIWPTAFRTYNLLVPNFLNLPFSLFGLSGPPASEVGVGMYVASRTAECPYCSAHTCSFALRRGASAETMAQALNAGAPLSSRQAAVVAVARALARIPSELQASERAALEREVGATDAEWIVAGVCMMGFLNKFMDAVGVELEPSTAAEVTSTVGAIWKTHAAGRRLAADAPAAPPPRRDSLSAKLRLVPLFPFALRTDSQWQRGVPADWPAVGDMLRTATGHDFPLLGRLRHARMVRSIATMLRDNLDPSSSVLGLDQKVLAGAIFASVVGDSALAKDIHALAPTLGGSAAALDMAERFARGQGELQSSSEKERAVLTLAKAASPSPAAIDSTVTAACQRAALAPAALVELITWLSVLQMLHRLGSYYAE